MNAQPIYRADGGLLGVEMLLRLGDVPALDVIAAAESMGRLVELEWAIIRHCIRQAAEFPDVGCVHINVTTGTLARRGGEVEIVQMLERYNVEPTRICFELSERSDLVGSFESASTLSVLSKMGIGFSIDDFGVGFNHLHVARLIAINSLKVDQSIVHAACRGGDIDARGRARRLLLGLNLLARELGAELILEGIEDTAEHQLMFAMNCAGQGYHLGRPVPLSEVLRVSRIHEVA